MTHDAHHRFRSCPRRDTIQLSRPGRDRAFSFFSSSGLCALCVSAISMFFPPLFPVRLSTLNFQLLTLFSVDHGAPVGQPFLAFLPPPYSSLASSSPSQTAPIGFCYSPKHMASHLKRTLFG